MIALYIIAAVLLLLFIVAMLPVSLKLKYKDEVTVSLSVMAIKLKEFPKKKKKIKISDYSKKALKKRPKNNNKLKSKPQNNKEEPQTKQKSLLESLEIIKDLLAVIISETWGKLKIKASKILITVATDDAAKTALLFPAVNTAVLGLITYLDNESKLVGLNSSDIAVRTDFTAQKPTADIEILFSLRLWQVLKILFAAALKYASHKIKQ